MKRQWNHPSIVLPLLIAVFLLLTFRSCSLRRRADKDDAGRYAVAVDARLAELAAVDPAASAVLRAAETLLAGNLTTASRAPPEHRDAAVRGLRDWLGKQQFDPHVMAELLDLIKRPIDRYHAAAAHDDDVPVRPYASCAVVGNSGILLSRERGALIDSHDLVIRLNNAPAGGTRLARHVGARTGLAFVNSNVLNRCTSARTGCRFCRAAYADHRVPILTYMCNAAHFVEHAVCSSADAETPPVIVTDPRLDAVCARVVKYYSLRRFVRETALCQNITKETPH